MREPIKVLNSLSNHSMDVAYKYERLYRNFYNPDFYSQAYINIKNSNGSMTKGTDDSTVDGMGKKRIENLISKMRDCSYKPSPARRIYIPKAKGGQRPIGIPSFDDKLVQEIARMILESIYEPTFSAHSHGFRPERSCHTAVQDIKQSFKGAKWFIEGDITGFFDNIDHQVLIGILKKRIKDEQFIALIWKFLKAGYMEYRSFQKTYSGTPQGSVISPILSNIYLNELDRYMEEFSRKFNRGEKRRYNDEYRYYQSSYRWYKVQKYSKAEWDALSDEERTSTISKARELDRKVKSMSSVDEMDPGFKRLSYVRYADDFLCGVVGSKKDAETIKGSIAQFLKEKLSLELSDKKTLITNARDKAKFLGYEIFINQSDDRQKISNGTTMRFHKGRIKVYVPKEKWVGRLKEYCALKIKQVNGKEVFEPVHRNCMVNNDDLEILNQFNSEIRGFYEYYKIADNVSVLNDFYYIMSYSMFKTYAAKYKTHISNIRRKYGLKRFAVPYLNKSGKQCKAYFYDGGFKVDRRYIKVSNVDLIPNSMENLNKNSLMLRLQSNVCEICGKTDTRLEVHHVHKLKDLSGKKNWEKIMIGRKRKTLVLCVACHDALHAGRLD